MFNRTSARRAFARPMPRVYQPRVVTPIPVIEMCDVAVRRVLGVDPTTWTGTLYVHCSGKTGELVFLSGVLPAVRKRLPAARVAVVTVEHYRYVLEHLRDRFDEAVLLSPRAKNLADSVSLHNVDFRNGFERYRNGLVVNCYRSHIGHHLVPSWPKGPYYHAFAESVGIERTEFVTPGWGEDLTPRWGDVAVAFASQNQHSSKRRAVPFTAAEWGKLAGSLERRGLEPVATGHPDDPRPAMPGWRWVDGGLEVAMTLAREARFVVGGNSGITFLAGLLSRGPVVMVDEALHLQLYDVSLMGNVIPVGKIKQVRIDGRPARDREAFAVALTVSESL